jgi:hypothetical protein
VCGKTKPLDQYYDGSGPGGKFTKCRDCCRQYAREQAKACRDARRRLEDGATRQSAGEIRALPDERLVQMVMRKKKLRLWLENRIDSINGSGVRNATLDGSVSAFRQVIRWLDRK